MPPSPLNEEQQRRVAAVMALVREIADVVSLEHLVSALLQAAAVWYDIDARGYRRASDDRFEIAAVLPGVAPATAAGVLRADVIARYAELTRVSAASDLEVLGSHEACGDLLVLPLPSGSDPLWVLTFSSGALTDAEPVLRGLSPLLDMVIDRWRVRQETALHARVLDPMARALETGEPAVALALDALRQSLGASGARFSLRDAEGDTRSLAVAGTLGDDVASVWFALGATGAATLDIAPAAGLGAARIAIFRDVARRVFLPWLAGALSNPPAFAAIAAGSEILDLAPRIRDEIANAARFGRGTAVLSIAFVGGELDSAAFDAARRGAIDAIARELRRDDAVGRIPGADLAVLVTDVTPDALPHASERVRRVLASAHLAGRAPAAVIGTALFPADGILADQLMEVARGHAARQIAAMNDSTWGREQA